MHIINLDHSSSMSTTKKLKTKKSVRFDDVTVYYFARSQSFVSVPSQGTVTLGKFNGEYY
jgi:cysteine/serine-rich nuclear protein